MIPGVVSVSLNSPPDPLRVTSDGRHVGHVVAVGVALLVLLAALRPEQEQDDDQDRERDQAEQAEKRRKARAGPDWAARWAGAAAAAAEGAAEGALGSPGHLLSLRLLEEVELDVWLAVTHCKWSRNSVERRHCNDRFGRVRSEGIGPAAANPPEAVSSAPQALPRQELVLDRYRPLRPLGSGGSGSVWLARDERTGLEVALKIIPREGKAADRAEREAEAASRLRHERCLRAYGFGSDSGHVYIAYEYVGGRTLREAMRSGDLRDGQAVEAAAQILDGLAHAHGRGIIHRDVKPSNVLLAEDDGISVRLLDFGLAQFDEAETLTAVGDVPGTLAYISPERLRGEEACPASDIWGVGILLWEALAGKHPFWGVPLQQMAGTIETGAPPLQVERPDLPKRLLSAIGHALASDPKKRPPAAALAKELRGALGDRRRVVQRVHVDVTRDSLAERGLPAAAAFVATLAGATMLPFFPAFWAPAFALAVGALTLRAPRAGLALALAAPILPLGNVALGLALLYGAIALGWLAPLVGRRAQRARVPGRPAARPTRADRARAARRSAGQGPRPPRRPGARGGRRRRARRRPAGKRAPVRPGRSRGSSTSPATRALSTRRSRSRAPSRSASSSGGSPSLRSPSQSRMPDAMADRRPGRRRACSYGARRADRSRATARRRHLAHLRRSRSSSRALELRPGVTLTPTA